VPLAIQNFLQQDYPNRELVILDDGQDSVADLSPPDSRVKYIRMTHRQTVGVVYLAGGAERPPTRTSLRRCAAPNVDSAAIVHGA
jgi:hypothetical protein